jgi:hypothetical protein
VFGFASAGREGHCWEVERGALAFDFAGDAFCAVAPRDTDWFAAGFYDVAIRSAEDGRVLRAYGDPQRRDAILSIDATADGGRILAVTQKAAVVYDGVAGTITGVRETNGRTGGALFPDGRSYALVSDDAVVRRVWIDGGRPDDGPAASPHVSSIADVRWDAAGALYSCDAASSLRWDDAGQPAAATFPERPAPPVWASQKREHIIGWLMGRYRDETTGLGRLVGSGGFAVSIDTHGDADVWTPGGDAPHRGIRLGSTPGSNVLGSSVTAADVNARGLIALATTRHDAYVQIWDAASGQPVLILDGCENVPRGIAFSPDGTRVAAGGDDRCVRVWTLPPGATTS